VTTKVRQRWGGEGRGSKSACSSDVHVASRRPLDQILGEANGRHAQPRSSRTLHAHRPQKGHEWSERAHGEQGVGHGQSPDRLFAREMASQSAKGPGGGGRPDKRSLAFNLAQDWSKVEQLSHARSRPPAVHSSCWGMVRWWDHTEGAAQLHDGATAAGSSLCATGKYYGGVAATLRNGRIPSGVWPSSSRCSR